jgi:hypothetical protein
LFHVEQFASSNGFIAWPDTAQVRLECSTWNNFEGRFTSLAPYGACSGITNPQTVNCAKVMWESLRAWEAALSYRVPKKRMFHVEQF